MESNVLNRVFALANNTKSRGSIPDAAASCLRQLKNAENPAAAAGSIAAVLGKLLPDDQEKVVAALEALAK